MLANLQLLVVDRSAALADTLRSLAVDLDIDMVQCASMSDAFAKVARLQPHVAVIDADLCDLGGVGVVRAVRVLAPACEVILTSVDPTSDAGLEAIRAGALECMTKAASITRLRTLLVRSCTGMQRTEQLLREFEIALGLDANEASLSR